MDIRPFPAMPHYLVREDGAVMRVGGKWLKAQRQKRGGYMAVGLWENNKGKLLPIHIIVALTFHGPRPSPEHQAAHNDGVKENCHRDNISWKTRKENEADKIAHGKTNRGPRNGMAELEDSDVLRIKVDQRAQSAIAADYGISQPTVSLIKTGKRWKHL